MNLQFLKDNKPFGQVLATLLISVIAGIFISLIGIVLAYPFVDGNVLSRIQHMGQMNHSGDLSLMRYFQFISQFGFFILPALLTAFLIQKNVFQYLSLDKAPILLHSIIGLLIIVAANPFSEWLIYQNNLIQLPESLSAIEEWMRNAESKAADMTNTFLEMESLSDYVINIIMIGIFAAIGEELLLRGILQPLFIKIFKNAHIGIWIAAFLFSFIHFQFYGFFARLFMGAILGYLFVYTKNLWVPIIIHFFNNAAAVTYVYITKTPLNSTNLDQIEKSEYGGIYAILSLSIVILGMLILKKLSNKASLRN